MPREVTIPQQVVQEEILSYDHHPGQFVRILVGFGSYDNAGLFVFDTARQPDLIEIANSNAVFGPGGSVVKPAYTDYADLMSAGPAWAPNKPAGTFRREDLWHFIDAVRARRYG